MTHRFHCRPTPTHHPLMVSAPKLLAPANTTLPPIVMLCDDFLPPRDQRQEGACSAFSTCGFREALHCIATGQLIDGYLSPAFLYAKTRMTEGTFPSDLGATLADELTALQTIGVCPESLMPYDANPAEVPANGCEAAAATYRIGQPQHVGWPGLVSIDAIRYALANGTPVVFGTKVFQSIYSTGPNGLIPVPPPNDAVLGYHAMVAVGYHDVQQYLTVRNSWGTGWAAGGYAYLPYSMVGYFSEAWTAAPLP